MMLALACTGCMGPLDRDAARKFENALGNANFVVYPTFVRAKSTAYDVPSAMELSRLLEDQKLGHAELSSEQIPIHGRWGHNQARMFRQSAEDIAILVKSTSPPGAYSVMAECLMAPDHVIGAHLYVLDSAGRMAYGILVNSHHDAFASRSPKTVADCISVLKEIVEDELGKDAKVKENAATTKS
jgi:hypothetical protein